MLPQSVLPVMRAKSGSAAAAADIAFCWKLQQKTPRMDKWYLGIHALMIYVGTARSGDGKAKAKAAKAKGKAKATHAMAKQAA